MGAQIWEHSVDTTLIPPQCPEWGLCSFFKPPHQHLFLFWFNVLPCSTGAEPSPSRAVIFWHREACECDRTLGKSPPWGSTLPTTTPAPTPCSIKILQAAQNMPSSPEPAGPLHPQPLFLQAPTEQRTLPVPSQPQRHHTYVPMPPPPLALQSKGRGWLWCGFTPPSAQTSHRPRVFRA